MPGEQTQAEAGPRADPRALRDISLAEPQCRAPDLRDFATLKVDLLSGVVVISGYPYRDAGIIGRSHLTVEGLTGGCLDRNDLIRERFHRVPVTFWFCGDGRRDR